MSNNLKPEWIKAKAISENDYSTITSISQKYKLHTVCQEACCPNINDCWSKKSATFLLMGDICTRNCRFCSVNSGNPAGYLDQNEPDNTAKAIKELDLNYIVLTSVDRDDLPDGGAEHLAKTVRAVNIESPDTLVEILMPDFNGNKRLLEKIVQSNPYVIGHNIETVEKLTPFLRDTRADYRLSLNVLKSLKEIDSKVTTKTALLLGFGETDTEIKKTLNDLKLINVDIVVIGQYLQPGKKQVPVKEYIHPDKFEYYRNYAKNLGFSRVISFPFARSSYKAGTI